MRASLLLCLLLLSGCSAPPSAEETAAQPPNIVVIVTDDQGWKDVSYHGAEFPTPNIDRLAREGVELDRFYATPICSPTRAGLLTGRAIDRVARGLSLSPHTLRGYTRDVYAHFHVHTRPQLMALFLDTRHPPSHAPTASDEDNARPSSERKT